MISIEQSPYQDDNVLEPISSSINGIMLV